eukprot:6067108-Amphidinium_carterae.1
MNQPDFYGRCLVCFRQTGEVKGKFNFSYLKLQECRPLRKHFKQRVDSAFELEPLEPQVEHVVGVG